MARHNRWTPGQCLQNVYFSLEATARQWFENHESTITLWAVFTDELRRMFASQHRRERAEEQLRAKVQGPNKTLVSFVEDVPRLSNRADPQASEAKKLWTLMRGAKENTFGGLVRNTPATTESLVTEAKNIERALLARASLYQGIPGIVSLAPVSLDSSLAGIRDVIREVVREELQKLLPTVDHPPSISIVGVLREKVR